MGLYRHVMMSERAANVNAWKPSTPVIGREFEIPDRFESSGHGRDRVHKYAIVYLTAFLIIASAFVVYSIPTSIPARISYNIHSPIYIDGDADLLAQKATESWPGDGSLTNPIKIRDYEIDASAAGYGIAVFNTGLHLVIEGCHVYGGTTAGIYLQSLTNATVTRCIVDSCQEAIGLQGVSNATVEGNRCSYSSDGFYVYGVTETLFVNNTGDQNNEGIYAYGTSWTEFMNCTFPYNSYGMYIETCENITVETCNASLCGVGLYAEDIYMMMVSNSTFSNAGSQGMWFQASSTFMVANSTVIGSGDGLYISLSTQFFIAHNNFSECSNGAYLYYCTQFAFENNTMDSDSGQGLLVDTCSNFGIRRNSISNSNIGIAANYANSTIEANEIWYCNYGISAQFSDQIRLHDNYCHHNSVGIGVQYSSDCEITNNTCTWCFNAGMYLDTISGSRISNNNCSGDSSILLLLYSDHNQLYNNFCSNNSASGIDLESSSNNTLRWNECDGNMAAGLYLGSSPDNVIESSTCLDNYGAGIVTSSGSDGAMMVMNTLTGNQKGILIEASRDSVLLNNYCAWNDMGGIAIEYSLNVTLGYNSLEHNGVWLDGNSVETWGSHSINKTNTVNGGPVVYLVNATSTSVAEDAGQVLLASCNAILVDGKDMTNATVGIEAGFSTTVQVSHCNLGWNYYGAYFYQTVDFGTSNCSFQDCWNGYSAAMGSYMMVDNCTFDDGTFGIALNNVNSGRIKDNHIDTMVADGIYFEQVSGVQIWRNTCLHSQTGMMTYSSNYMDISNNTFNLNLIGLMIDQSMVSMIDNNTCSYNVVGIDLFYATDCILKGNTMVQDGISLTGGYLENWNSHSIATSNTANGKPVYYFKDLSGFTVPDDGGQVILANCSSVDVFDSDLSNATVGVSIGFSDNIYVNHVNCSRAQVGIGIVASNLCIVNGSDFSDEESYGIYLEQSVGCDISYNTVARDFAGLYSYSSSQCEITRNLFYANMAYGVDLEGTSTQNKIWNNTFAYNMGANDIRDPDHIQAYDSWTGNTWFDTGSVRSWGNYWNDWTSPDMDTDGIVDSPYNLGGPAGSSDFYPLVNPPSGFEPIPQFSFALVVPLVMLLVVLVRRRLK